MWRECACVFVISSASQKRIPVSSFSPVSLLFLFLSVHLLKRNHKAPGFAHLVTSEIHFTFCLNTLSFSGHGSLAQLSRAELSLMLLVTPVDLTFYDVKMSTVRKVILIL